MTLLGQGVPQSSQVGAQVVEGGRRHSQIDANNRGIQVQAVGVALYLEALGRRERGRWDVEAHRGDDMGLAGQPVTLPQGVGGQLGLLRQRWRRQTPVDQAYLALAARADAAADRHEFDAGRLGGV